MSNFQASLTSATTGTIDVSAANGCTSILVTDWSNYSTNTSPPTQLPLFNAYRTVTVQYYSGNVLTVSSVAIPPTCAPVYPSLALGITVPITTGDGFYLVTLNTLPSWGLAIGYTQGVDQVWNTYDNNMYTCISSNTSTALNRPDLAPTLWQLVPSANIPTTLYSKYVAFGYFALSCGIASCLPNLVSKALCGATGCNAPDFCNSQDFQNAAIAFMGYYAVQSAASSGQIQFQSATWDLLKKICNC